VAKATTPSSPDWTSERSGAMSVVMALIVAK
jgi:hypothetical protein